MHASQTEKEDLSLCRHWFCIDWYIIDNSNVYVAVLITIVRHRLQAKEGR